MIARLLVSFGSVAAAVGFTIFGMATTYLETDDDMATKSYWLMGGGIVAAVIGAFWYRLEERNAEVSAHSSSRQS